MRRVLAAVALLLSSVALADVDPAFAKLRDEALKEGGAVESLSAFLDKYVGECDSALGGRECKENAKAFRRSATGKKFYLVMDEESVTQLSPGPYNPRGEMTINVTPFFPAGGYALTHGAPRKTDENGNPIMPLLPVKAKLPDDWNGSSLARYIGMRVFRLQLVFVPQDVWTLSKPRGGKAQGVKAKLLAILITSGRTGKELAVWTAK